MHFFLTHFRGLWPRLAPSTTHWSVPKQRLCQAGLFDFIGGGIWIQKRGQLRQAAPFSPQAPRELPGVALNNCLTHGNTHWTFSSAKNPLPSQITLDMPHLADAGRGFVGLTDWPTDASGRKCKKTGVDGR